MARKNSGDYGKEMRRQLLTAGICSPRELFGCNVEEVSDLAVSNGAILPRAYWGFLQAAGRGAGDFFRGTDIFYRSLPIPRQVVQEMIDRDERAAGFTLPDKVFVFASHQGYSFLYFAVEEDDDDPAVFAYVEDEGPPRQVAESFTQWFSASVTDHAEL